MVDSQRNKFVLFFFFHLFMYVFIHFTVLTFQFSFHSHSSVPLHVSSVKGEPLPSSPPWRMRIPSPEIERGSSQFCCLPVDPLPQREGVCLVLQ